MSTYLSQLARSEAGQWSNDDGLQAVAAAVDRLAEQQRARNLLALATAEHRGLDNELVDEARNIITAGPIE
ncbi:hypothetical protein LG293_17925 (plasmid) [Citricoccus nitrophenolicus]